MKTPEPGFSSFHRPENTFTLSYLPAYRKFINEDKKFKLHGKVSEYY
jgi:hypothetical protein